MPKKESDRILTLELNQEQMVKDIQEIKNDVKEINAKFDMIIERMEKKFASKRVERVVKGMVGLVLLTVFGAIIGQIIV